jgi:amino acid transporter
MAIGALIYVAVAVTAVSVVPWRERSQAPGPLTDVMARAAPVVAPWVFTAVTLFAVANAALVNYRPAWTTQPSRLAARQAMRLSCRPGTSAPSV